MGSSIKEESNKLLCTPEEVYAVAGITDKSVMKQERDRIEQLIGMEPFLLWGDNHKRKIRKKERRAGTYVAYSVALKSNLISDEIHTKLIKEALNNSEFSVGKYEIVRNWLNNNWKRLTTMALAGIQLYIFKGEFEHYDEVKEHIKQVHKEGGNVRILKGLDKRTSLVVDDLLSIGVQVRVHDNREPKFRLYLIDNRYLYFVSTPEGTFLSFKGSNPRTLKVLEQLFERHWDLAEKPSNVA